MTSLVSIIIPVFNVEKYVENCLNSLVCQTYQNIEIICIDDGSTDLSGDKIISFTQKDNRIKYYKKENSGVSSARNYGLTVASGEYIVFVDADDYLHFQAVEILLSCIENTNYDMIFSHEIITHSLNEKMTEIGNFNCTPSDEIKLFENFENTVCGKSVCFKIYNSVIAKKQQFPENFTNGEDAYYNLMLINSQITIGEVDSRIYYYYQRENSLVNSEFSKKQFSITLCFNEICEKLKSSDNEFIKAYALKYLFQTCFYNRTLSIGSGIERYVKTEIKKIGKNRLSDFLHNKNIDIKIRIIFTVFYYSRHIYELARYIKDPTMLDFYRNRRKRG